ncbi:UxaA family hydrolase [Rhodococcus koreensis]
MTQISAYPRTQGQPGARNHVFVLPSVVCSALVAAEIADAAGATAVAHQHGCGHIGQDIVQTRALFAGLASSPNVAQSLVVSLGCETVQGRGVVDEIVRQGRDPHFVGIQASGGSTAAREEGIRVAKKLKTTADAIEREAADASALTLGIVADRKDDRLADLVAHAVARGARVVLAGSDDADLSGLAESPVPLAVGSEPGSSSVSVLAADPGAQSARVLAVASCRPQVIVEFPAENQPPSSIALVPVVGVAAAGGLHAAIPGEFDIAADGDAVDIWSAVLDIFSGVPAKSELRNSTTFAIPRLLRTM